MTSEADKEKEKEKEEEQEEEEQQQEEEEEEGERESRHGEVVYGVLYGLVYGTLGGVVYKRRSPPMIYGNPGMAVFSNTFISRPNIRGPKPG